MDSLRNIALELDQEQELEQLQLRLSTINEFAGVRIGLLGGARIGKTAIISSILELELADDNFKTGVCLTVEGGSEKSLKHDGKDLQSGDIKALLSRLTEAKDSSAQSLRIQATSPHEWLVNKHYRIVELPELIISTSTPDQSILDYLSVCDVCLFLLDAIMPYSRNDMLILQALEKHNIPTLVAINKYDLLPTESCAEIERYIDSRLGKFQNLTILENHRYLPLCDMEDELREALDKIAAASKTAQTRSLYRQALLTEQVNKWIALYESKLRLLEERQTKVKAAADTKLMRLDEKNDQFVTLQYNLIEKQNALLKYAANKIESRKGNILKVLSHSIETTNDVGNFWEKELVFQLEMDFKKELQIVSRDVDQKIMETIRWLQKEANPIFSSKGLPLTITLTQEGSSRPNDSLELSKLNSQDINAPDLQRLQINMRIGTTVAVVAFGLVFVTNPIMGAISGLMVASGVGANIFSRYETNKARAKAIKLLPIIVDRATEYCKQKTSESVSELFRNIFEQMNSQINTWNEQNLSEINSETQRAQANCVNNQWNENLKLLKKLVTQTI